VICAVVVLFLLAIAGGILLWKFLPEDQKKNVTALVDGGIRFGDTGEAPPPDYQFIECSSSSISSGDCCNGLTNLCDMGVHEILFGGIHNAQSSVEDGFLITPNHQYNAIAALDYGYRAINLDIGICDGELSLIHGFCRLGSTDPATTFQAINDWLDAHPTEVIILPLQIDNSAGGDDEPDVDLARIYNMLNRIDGFTERMYQSSNPTSNSGWPTLRELIDTDKRILLFHYNGGECMNNPNMNCPPGFHDWFQSAAETKFEYTDLDDFMDKPAACQVTRGRPRAPFYALNLFTTIPSLSLAEDSLNTQSFLTEHIAACSAVNGNRDVNILFVDFWSEGDVPRTVQDHNRQLVPVSTDSTGGGRRRQRRQTRRRGRAATTSTGGTRRFLRYFF